MDQSKSKKGKNSNGNNNSSGRAACVINRRHRSASHQYCDPELEAELFYAAENGCSLPKSTGFESLVKATAQSLEDDQFYVKVGKNGGGNCKAERKARSRGVSGCSIKKDGNRFEYGMDCIDLAYGQPLTDDSDSEAEYDEYADYMVKYSNEEIRSIVRDYLLNGNREETLGLLEKFKITNDTLTRVVKDVVQLSAEEAVSENLELGSQLLSEIVLSKWLTIGTLIGALKEMVDSLDELIIDSPKISEGMAILMAKLVEQKVITCEMIKMIAKQQSEENRAAVQCYADALTFTSNRTLLLGKCSPSGGHQSVEVLSAQFKPILREHLQSNDSEATALRVKELHVPHFNHEFVYQTGLMALESHHDNVMAQLSTLLKDMFENGVLSLSSLQKGYERLFESLNDLYYDLPAAHTLAQRWVDKSLKAKIIDTDTAKKCPKCPQRARGRTLSEGPDGKLSVDDDPSDADFDIKDDKASQHSKADLNAAPGIMVNGARA